MKNTSAAKPPGLGKLMLPVLAVIMLAFSFTTAARAQTNSLLSLHWLPLPLKFQVQHPYDLPAADRYHFDATNNIHDLWVYFTDKPHDPPPNKTNARTEMRFDPYHQGVHMFEAEVNVNPGTFASIAQVFDAAHGPVTMLIARPDGRVTANGHVTGGSSLITTNVINRWWNLKMINDLRPGGKITIYADNVLAGTFENRGLREYYFKCGVYSRDGSQRSEARFRNVKLWVAAP